MSQNIYFYEIIVFSEDLIQDIPAINVYNSVKSLFNGGDNYAAEYIEKYFKIIPLNSIFINVNQIKKHLPRFSKKLKYVFNPNHSTFFMLDQEIWSGLEKIIEQNIREIFEQKENTNTADRLRDTSELSTEYILLSNLFLKKMLFASIF